MIIFAEKSKRTRESTAILNSKKEEILTLWISNIAEPLKRERISGRILKKRIRKISNTLIIES